MRPHDSGARSALSKFCFKIAESWSFIKFKWLCTSQTIFALAFSQEWKSSNTLSQRFLTGENAPPPRGVNTTLQHGMFDHEIYQEMHLLSQLIQSQGGLKQRPIAWGRRGRRKVKNHCIKLISAFSYSTFVMLSLSLALLRCSDNLKVYQPVWNVTCTSLPFKHASFNSNTVLTVVAVSPCVSVCARFVGI